MNRNRLHFIIILLCLVIFQSCEKTDASSLPLSSIEEENYTEGEDYNPSLYSELYDHSVFSETKDGALFIAGDYLFYVSGDSLSVHPLCYKTECLHLEETDESKIPQCNAFVGNSMLPFISVHQNKCYMTCIDLSDGKIDLIKMNLDGSERKTLINDVRGQGIYEMVMHRGVIYCITDLTTADGEHFQQILALSTVSNKNRLIKLYEITGDEFSLSGLLPYGNYIYFYEMSGVETDSAQMCSKRYSIQTGKIEEISTEAVIPVGIQNSQIVIRGLKTAEYWRYSSSEETIEPETYGIRNFITQHPNWNCHVESMDDKIMAFQCYDREKSDFVHDLIITDADGNETAILEGESWGMMRSAIVSLNNQKYYIHVSSELEPFSVDAYRVADLLQGIVDPVNLLKVSDYNSLCPGFTY